MWPKTRTYIQKLRSKKIMLLVSHIYNNPTIAGRVGLIESDDSVVYMESMPKAPRTDQSLERYGDYGEYYDPGSSESDKVNETDLEYYMKQLALLGPSTKAYGGPNVKHRFSFTFFTIVTEKQTHCTRKKPRSRSPSTHVYLYTQRKTKYPRTSPNPNKKTRLTTRQLQFSTAAVRRKRLIEEDGVCKIGENYVCDGTLSTEFMHFSTTPVVRKKRWVGDSPERMDRYTTFDSLDRELLYSGRYAPWQIKFYAMRKYFDKNMTPPFVTKKRIVGKQKLKKLLRKKSIHEPGYKQKLRMMSFDQIYNDSRLFPWNATVRQIYKEKRWKHLTQKLPVL
ncbi:uncharacterized protein LOC135838341 isoform X2 [Planococcus citri]|uniref:uncharacterized protein LOC135838341 isoform X2 n=1 Tax=Planococcus citri TaxID=170843 RepID=UPI0031FA0326